MKPNLQLAKFLSELIAEYDENKNDEILNNLSKKWQIESEEIEFYLEAVNSYYYRPVLSSVVASAGYDENFNEVFKAMDYLNGKIDEQGNLKTSHKIRSFILNLLKSNLKWFLIIIFTLIFGYLVRVIIYFLYNLFS